MTEVWPNPACAYERPTDTPDHTARWQDALTRALNEVKSLELAAITKQQYRLAGDCPRCGHHTEQELTFRVIRGLAPKQLRTHRFNFDCRCGKPHEGAPEDDGGCGWGGPLTVSVRRS